VCALFLLVVADVLGPDRVVSEVLLHRVWVRVPLRIGLLVRIGLKKKQKKKMQTGQSDQTKPK
jgi:hypothetical protein